MKPVTRAEIKRWLRDVPKLDPASPRAAYYVRHWNVIEKIQRQKQLGQRQ